MIKSGPVNNNDISGYEPDIVLSLLSDNEPTVNLYESFCLFTGVLHPGPLSVLQRKRGGQREDGNQAAPQQWDIHGGFPSARCEKDAQLTDVLTQHWVTSHLL